MKSVPEIKTRLNKSWASYTFHKAWLNHETRFPYQIKLGKPSDKTLLHQFDEVRTWISDLSSVFAEPALIAKDTAQKQPVRIIKKEFNFDTMGRQTLPVAIEFYDIEALARFLGKWRQWQQFCLHFKKISTEFPALKEWLKQSPASIQKYSDSWPELINVCHYFLQHPQPDSYIRELNINNVDTKFVERHKAVLKIMLDLLLPESAIHKNFEQLNEHGFEKRFGLRYEQPRVHFRLLDSNMSSDFSGLSDMEIPIEQFAQLDLLCDRIFITENKTNGLAFPETNNAIVIFGLGYGIQMLKQVNWLKQCQLYYWGDIDTHGFAILSAARSHFPKLQSWLMDEATLLHCKAQWGEEPEDKSHQAEVLPHLNNIEQSLYQRLKTNHWRYKLRLEQEKIPFDWWQTQLKALK